MRLVLVKLQAVDGELRMHGADVYDFVHGVADIGISMGFDRH